jgi:hypothetical protein
LDPAFCDEAFLTRIDGLKQRLSIYRKRPFAPEHQRMCDVDGAETLEHPDDME